MRADFPGLAQEARIRVLLELERKEYTPFNTRRWPFDFRCRVHASTPQFFSVAMTNGPSHQRRHATDQVIWIAAHEQKP